MLSESPSGNESVIVGGGDPGITREAIQEVERKTPGRRKLNHVIRGMHADAQADSEMMCRETLQLMADGIGIAEIAQRFGKNYYCLKNHLNRFYNRHGLDNAYMAIGRGFREGWIK